MSIGNNSKYFRTVDVHVRACVRLGYMETVRIVCFLIQDKHENLVSPRRWISKLVCGDFYN